jgi:DNA-binding MurR/RpiR family transcriptional regulator
MENEIVKCFAGHLATKESYKPFGGCPYCRRLNRSDFVKNQVAMLRTQPNARGRTMSYSLSEAAAACGVNRTTIFRALQKGKISGTRDANSEVHRLYRPISANGGDVRAQATQLHTAHEAELQAAQATVAELRERVQDLRDDRDRWRTLAEAVTRQLADQRPIITPPPIPRGITRRWWRWG